MKQFETSESLGVEIMMTIFIIITQGLIVRHNIYLILHSLK